MQKQSNIREKLNMTEIAPSTDTVLFDAKNDGKTPLGMRHDKMYKIKKDNSDLQQLHAAFCKQA